MKLIADRVELTELLSILIRLETHHSMTGAAERARAA